MFVSPHFVVPVMASIRVDGHEVLLLLHLNEDGVAEVTSHLLHVRYGFLRASIYVEEEIMSDAGALLQSVLISKSSRENTDMWLLPRGCFRAFGLSPDAMDASTELLTPMSDASTELL